MMSIIILIYYMVIEFLLIYLFLLSVIVNKLFKILLLFLSLRGKIITDYRVSVRKYRN